MKDKRQYYVGRLPIVCEECGKTNLSIFVDAATVKGWLRLCDKCFAKLGHGIGTGKATRFQLLSNGKWLKIDPKPIKQRKPPDIQDRPDRVPF